jgi:choline kinase
MRRHYNSKFIVSPKRGDSRPEELVTVILLSENVGHRMKSYGSTSLLSLGNATVLEHQINAIKSLFVNYEIILCGGFDIDRVVKFVNQKYRSDNVRVIENQMYLNSNDCESVRLCLNNTTNSRVLICNGELLLTSNCLHSLDLNRSHIVVEKKNSPNLEIGVTVNQDGFAENFCYGVDLKWSEIVFLQSSEIIESLRKIISTPDYKTKFIFEALNELGRMTKYKLKVVENLVPTVKIDNVKTYHQIRKHYESVSTKLRRS